MLTCIEEQKPHLFYKLDRLCFHISEHSNHSDVSVHKLRGAMRLRRQNIGEKFKIHPTWFNLITNDYINVFATC